MIIIWARLIWGNLEIFAGLVLHDAASLKLRVVQIFVPIAYGSFEGVILGCEPMFGDVGVKARVFLP